MHLYFIAKHDLLKETGTLGSNSINTPIKQNHRPVDDNNEAAVDQGMYQRLVGKLLYYHMVSLI